MQSKVIPTFILKIPFHFQEPFLKLHRIFANVHSPSDRDVKNALKGLLAYPERFLSQASLHLIENWIVSFHESRNITRYEIIGVVTSRAIRKQGFIPCYCPYIRETKDIF